MTDLEKQIQKKYKTRCRCAHPRWIVQYYKKYRQYPNPDRKFFNVFPCKSSLLVCINCQSAWRTAARYVEKLRERDPHLYEPL